jgi:hypothetical protein
MLGNESMGMKWQNKRKVYRCLQGRRGVQEIREMRKNQNEN